MRTKRLLSHTIYRKLDGIVKAYSPTLKQRILEASDNNTKPAPPWAHSAWDQLQQCCRELSRVRINEGCAVIMPPYVQKWAGSMTLKSASRLPN